MLASILKTDVASIVSVNIMRAFVKMRRYISNNLLEHKYYSDMIIKHDKEIKLLQESFNRFAEKKKLSELFFDGQIYDAYSKILDIFKSSKKQLIIIDTYADIKVLDMIKNLTNIKVTIICSNKYMNKDIINTYNKQYNNLKVIINNSFHDRYFIIDNKIIYHCGSSINRIGYKTFSINMIEDNECKELLINRINNIK